MGSIELGKSAVRAGVKTFIDLRDPTRREKLLFNNRSDIEQSMVCQYVDKHKRWGTVIGFMSNFARIHGVPEQEIPGLADVMTLVLATDKVIDQPGKFKTAMSPEEFKRELLTQTIDGTTFTIGQLLHETEQRYASSPDKKVALGQFLDRAIEVQARLGSQLPGEYSFEDAVAYREATNSAGLDLAFYLADIHASRLVATAKQYIRRVQFKDDLGDVGEDFREQSINLFLGMASLYKNELNVLRTKMVADTSFVPGKVWLKRNMPDTFKAYKRRIKKEKWKLRLLEAGLFVPRVTLRRGRDI